VLLARKPASHDVSSASVGSTVESEDVAEDREAWQNAVALPGKQDFLGVRVALDGSNAAMSEEMPGQDASSAAGEQV
jgi:hypothetical protein